MELDVNNKKISNFSKQLNLKNFKILAKKLHIKKYSNMNKKEIVKNVLLILTVIKIQRWFRKKMINEEKCPISLEKIDYPCYPYKTGNSIRYYKLYFLKTYLIESGNFSDPLSRIKYTDKQLKQIDDIDIYYRSYFKVKEKYKSVYSFSKKYNYYNKKKDLANELLIIERILDISCQDIINILINERLSNEIFDNIHNIYLRSYKINFERIFLKDINHAEYIINKNINNILCIVEEIDETKIGLYSYVTNFMYNLKDKYI